MDHNDKSKAIDKLIQLKSLALNGCLESRINFILMTFRFNLYTDLITHNLNEFGISCMDLDYCVACDEASKVIHGVMAIAITEPRINRSIKNFLPETWEKWHATYLLVEAKNKDGQFALK